MPAFLDHTRRRGGLGAPIWLTGNMRADMERLRAFFGDKRHGALRHELAGEIRLLDEG